MAIDRRNRRRVTDTSEPSTLRASPNVPQHLRPPVPGHDLRRKPRDRDRLRGRRLPAADPADQRGHPARSRSPPSRPIALHHPAPGAGRGQDPVRRDGASRDRRAGDDGNADRAADREHRPALQGLFRDQGQVSPRPRRLHLRGQIRPARLSRRRTFVGARDRDARRGRRHRAKDPARGEGARRAGADGPAQDRSRQLGLGRDRAQSVLLPGQGQGRVLRAVSRRHPQERLLDRRRDRSGRRRRAARPAARRSTPSSTANWRRR